MRSAIAAVAFAAAAYAFPAVGDSAGPAPAGCQTTVSGTFQITVVNITGTAKRSVEKRDTLMLSLSNSVLTDQAGRIGNIVANHQFQFDPAPGQAGAIYTKGFSVCANGSLAIGASTTFYQCLSGDFYNLYDQSQGAQCSPINIVAMGASTSATVTQSKDGQVQATSVSQRTDGQPIATSATAKVTQISDGQLQAISQISDGQLQMPTGKPVSQITDGQVQAPKATSSGKPVSQITDGQVQAPKSTSSGKPVSQITDGQVQAAKSTSTSAAKVSQITDGQVQAAATTTTAAVAQFTGAASNFGPAVAAVAGVAAAVAMF